MLSQLYSNDPREARTKTFLTGLYEFPKGIMPVGRLDEKSEGLLLLTTDGKLSDTINRSGIEKNIFASGNVCFADQKSINRNSDIFKDVYSYYPGAPALCHLECLGTDRCVAAVFTVTYFSMNTYIYLYLNFYYRWPLEDAV